MEKGVGEAYRGQLAGRGGRILSTVCQSTLIVPVDAYREDYVR